MAYKPQVLAIADGGTNASTMATSTGIVKYDGTRLVTSSTATIDASNRYQNSSQPIFSAYLSANASNVTGDGTVYTIIFDTALVNVGTCYNTGTGVFTAPVTGNYLFTSTVSLLDIAVGHTSGICSFLGSVREDRFWRGNPFNTADVGGALSVTGSFIVPMTAADTMHVFAFVSGSTKTVDVAGTSQPYTCFAAFLLS